MGEPAHISHFLSLAFHPVFTKSKSKDYSKVDITRSIHAKYYSIAFLNILKFSHRTFALFS